MTQNEEYICYQDDTENRWCGIIQYCFILELENHHIHVFDHKRYPNCFETECNHILVSYGPMLNFVLVIINTEFWQKQDCFVYKNVLYIFFKCKCSFNFKVSLYLVRCTVRVMYIFPIFHDGFAILCFRKVLVKSRMVVFIWFDPRVIE